MKIRSKIALYLGPFILIVVAAIFILNYYLVRHTLTENAQRELIKTEKDMHRAAQALLSTARETAQGASLVDAFPALAPHLALISTSLTTNRITDIPYWQDDVEDRRHYSEMTVYPLVSRGADLLSPCDG